MAVRLKTRRQALVTEVDTAKNQTSETKPTQFQEPTTESVRHEQSGTEVSEADNPSYSGLRYPATVVSGNVAGSY